MANDSNGKQKETTTAGKRQRSPGFPSISLEDAISRLRVIYQFDKRAFTTAQTILTHLGYKGNTSGTAGRVVAALKHFGLLEEKNGQYRVSDVGFRLLHLPEDSSERKELIKELALAPPVFARVFLNYEGDIPSDDTLKSHLIFSEKFNPDSVDHFIRVFRETIGFANPTASPYNQDESNTTPKNAMNNDVPLSKQPHIASAFERMFDEISQNSPAEIEAVGKTKPLFKYSVPLSIQRDVNAQLVITGESLKRRDLEVLAKKVKDLLDAFEDEEEADLD